MQSFRLAGLVSSFDECSNTYETSYSDKQSGVHFASRAKNVYLLCPVSLTGPSLLKGTAACPRTGDDGPAEALKPSSQGFQQLGPSSPTCSLQVLWTFSCHVPGGWPSTLTE